MLRIGALPVLDPDQLMKEAVDAASKADAVILAIGTDEERESEAYDRDDMKYGSHTLSLSHLLIKI